MTIGSVVLLLAEFTHPGFVTESGAHHRGPVLVLLPILVLVAGPVIAISTWLSSRQDRRILRIIHASSMPHFYLPVIAKGIRISEDLPEPQPLIWTIDRAGLHGWARNTAVPTVVVAWSAIHDIRVANKQYRGQLTGYGISIHTDDRTLVLRCRTALGRSFEVGERQLGVLLQVLSSLRRDFDPSEQ